MDLHTKKEEIPGSPPSKSDSKNEKVQFTGKRETKMRKRSDVSVEEEPSCCAVCQMNPSGSSGDPSCPQCGKRSRTDPGPLTTPLTRTEQRDGGLQEVIDEQKISLRKRCERVTEGIDETGSRTFLNRIYTELYITEGLSEEVNTQHEVRQLDKASEKKTLQDKPIQCQDIFKPSPDQQKLIRVVLTNGVAGVGKTFSVQKFTLDWAEGSENQDLSLVVPLSFRELNLIRDVRYSLLSLLHVFHPTLQKLTAETLAVCKLLFIFDGLDESRLPLDFDITEVVSDVTQRSSVNVLLTNLIKGNLLPSALIWITSRPAAANQIPPSCVDRVTEVRGFTDAQKEEYFRRRFRDEDLSNRIISHIKTSRSLHIMCQIPVFCWITATVLEHMMSTEQRGELPKTLTDLYSHFLLVQTQRKKKKYHEGQETSPQELMEADGEVLLKLGRLAFENLEEGNIMFYQEDLERCGLDVTEASVYSGVCTEIFRGESVIFQKPVYSFVHLSVQEFLAAVYMFHCFTNKNTAVLEAFLEDNTSWLSFFYLKKISKLFINSDSGNSTLDVFLKRAMEKSLVSKNGHLDLFVRFLHGLSLESNQRLLGGLLGHTDSSPEMIQRVINNLKEINSDEISPDRRINIFYCLMEMKDLSAYNEIQKFLKSEEEKLSERSRRTLADMLHMIGDEINSSDELQRMLESHAERPYRKAIISVLLRLCEAGISALQFHSYYPDLRDIKLQDSGQQPKPSISSSDDDDVNQVAKEKLPLYYDEEKAPQPFSPEKIDSTYRFRCPGKGVFQCTSTGLVFVMAKEAELLYGTVQWDLSFLEPAGKKAAGPLFKIKCSEKAVRQLHFPHCEPQEALLIDDVLSVAHVTDDGMSFLKPLHITDTHVVVDVPHLSALGLVWDFIKRFLENSSPVDGLVLLFLRPPDDRHQVLDVFLVPENTDMDKLVAQQEGKNKTQIEISSACLLNHDQRYIIQSEPQFYLQPKSATFRLKYGQSFVPTFEVFLKSNPEEVCLIILDQDQREVWKRTVFLTGLHRESRLDRVSAEEGDPAEDGDPADDGVQAQEKLFSARTQFVKSVSNSVLKDLLDRLLQRGVINDGEMDSFNIANREDKAREVIDTIRRKGNEASLFFISALRELDPYLSRKLKLR